MSLIRHDGPMPPGGYYFADPRTGMAFEGMSCTFDEQVQRIIKHRLANPKVYLPSDTEHLSPTSVAVELDDYTCQRIGNNSNYCTGGIGTSQPARVVVRTCPKCGKALTEKICATCSGRRVTGYKCDVCKTEFPK